jgi:hypothetical protein
MDIQTLIACNALGMYSVPVIGSGPIATAPPASGYWAQGGIGPLYYNTDDGQSYVSVRSFNNDGIDYGDWGNVASIRSATLPNMAFKLRVVVRARTLGQTALILSLSGGVNFAQWGIVQFNNSFMSQVGSQKNSAIAETTNVVEIICESNGTNQRIIVNGVTGPLVGNGANTYNGNIFIGGRTDGVTSNWDGETFLAEIKNASNQCIACFNANSPLQWNGGSVATDSAGNVISFTDSTPLGRVAYSWIKLSDAQAWGLLL